MMAALYCPLDAYLDVHRQRVAEPLYGLHEHHSEEERAQQDEEHGSQDAELVLVEDDERVLVESRLHPADSCKGKGAKSVSRVRSNNSGWKFAPWIKSTYLF